MEPMLPTEQPVSLAVIWVHNRRPGDGHHANPWHRQRGHPLRHRARPALQLAPPKPPSTCDQYQITIAEQMYFGMPT